VKPNLTGRSGSWHIMALGAVLMSASWVGDSLLDAFFEAEAIVSEIFFPDLHEVCIRLLFMGAQFSFLLYVAYLLRKRKRLEDSLETALCLAREEQNKSEAILEVLGDAISIQDTDLRILYQNRAHQEMMGDRVGEYCYQAYQGSASACAGCHLQRSFQDGETHRRESSADTARGRRHFEIISTPLRNSAGEIVAGIESVRDITERKEAEAENLRLNADLRQQTAELKALNRELESFNYSLSHDLKTPLTGVYAAAQALSEGYAERLDENGRYFIESICRGSERLDELLDAMLLLSGATRAELAREAVDLSALARLVLQELQSKAPERQVEWRIAPDLVASGDPRLLRSVLENLLGNAWKYTRMVPAACIEFGCDKQEDGRIYFIRDNGAGFDMHDADRLFRPFSRLHRESEFKGKGIGLATVQRIVQRHGGKVWAEGEPGRGATFYFTL